MFDKLFRAVVTRRMVIAVVRLKDAPTALRIRHGFVDELTATHVTFRVGKRFRKARLDDVLAVEVK